MNKSFKIFLLAILISTFYLLLSTYSFAAVMYFDAPAAVSPGQDFPVKVMIDTEGQTLNAFEGEIIYPTKVVDLIALGDGSSVVSNWIEKESSKNGKISFSGITANGFKSIYYPDADQKSQGLLLEIIFRGKTAGVGDLLIKNAKAIIHDGQGSLANLTTKGVRLSLEGDLKIDSLNFNDITSPEKFSIEVAKDNNLYEGKPTLIFATQDKESGINHYEVRINNSEFKSAKSPYLLEGVKYGDIIYVRAIDNAGNERTEAMEYRRSFSNEGEISSALLLVVVFLLAAVLFITWIFKRN